MDPLRPHDITKLVVGNVRVVRAPIDEDVPTSLADIQPLVASSGAYPLAGDWDDWGTIPDGEESSYTHGRESEGIAIENDTGILFEEITDVSRSFSHTVAEIDPANLQILENASAIETIAAATNESAQKHVPFGSYTQLERYRIAFIGRRPIEAGEVVEPSGKKRPRLVCVYLNRATLAAEDNEISFGKGSLASGQIQFTGYPEPGLPAEEAYGGWFLEDAGTIDDGA